MLFHQIQLMVCGDGGAICAAGKEHSGAIMSRVMAGCLILLFVSFFARADVQALPELNGNGLLTEPVFDRLSINTA